MSALLLGGIAWLFAGLAAASRPENALELEESPGKPEDWRATCAMCNEIGCEPVLDYKGWNPQNLIGPHAEWFHGDIGSRYNPLVCKRMVETEGFPEYKPCYMGPVQSDVVTPLCKARQRCGYVFPPEGQLDINGVKQEPVWLCQDSDETKRYWHITLEFVDGSSRSGGLITHESGKLGGMWMMDPKLAAGTTCTEPAEAPPQGHHQVAQGNSTKEQTQQECVPQQVPGLACTSGIMYRSLSDDDGRCAQPWQKSDDLAPIAQGFMTDRMSTMTGERRLLCGNTENAVCNKDVALRFDEKEIHVNGKAISAAGTTQVVAIRMREASEAEAQDEWTWIGDLASMSNKDFQIAATEVVAAAHGAHCPVMSDASKWLGGNQWWIMTGLGSTSIFAAMSAIPGGSLIALFPRLGKAFIEIIQGMDAGPCSKKPSMDCGASVKTFKMVTQIGFLIVTMSSVIFAFGSAIVVPGAGHLIAFLSDAMYKVVASLTTAVWGAICASQARDTFTMVREVLRMLTRGSLLATVFGEAFGVDLDVDGEVGFEALANSEDDTKIADTALTYGKDGAKKLKGWLQKQKKALAEMFDSFIAPVRDGLMKLTSMVQKAFSFLHDRESSPF